MMSSGLGIGPKTLEMTKFFKEPTVKDGPW